VAFNYRNCPKQIQCQCIKRVCVSHNFERKPNPGQVTEAKSALVVVRLSIATLQSANIAHLGPDRPGKQCTSRTLTSPMVQATESVP